MTREFAVEAHELDRLQWGHGAWPWMTSLEQSKNLYTCQLQWGHGAWPWMTCATIRPSRNISGSFNGATAHGRG